MTKAKLIQALAERTELTKNQVNIVLDQLIDITEESLKAEGVFSLPDLVKFTVKDKIATPERQGVNPFTKEPITVQAKPASKRVKSSVIGSLKKIVL